MRLSREKTVRLSHRIIDFLVSSPDVDFVEDRDTIRQEIVTILTSLLKLEEQVDTEVRAKIASQKKEILEGSEEWDILYRKYYAEGLKRLGVAEVHTPLNSFRLSGIQRTVSPSISRRNENARPLAGSLFIPARTLNVSAVGRSLVTAADSDRALAVRSSRSGSATPDPTSS